MSKNHFTFTDLFSAGQFILCKCSRALENNIYSADLYSVYIEFYKCQLNIKH